MLDITVLALNLHARHVPRGIPVLLLSVLLRFCVLLGLTLPGVCLPVSLVQLDINAGETHGRERWREAWKEERRKGRRKGWREGWGGKTSCD